MLMLNLDHQTRSPIYEQIVNQIERYVALGVLKPKEQIPSIRELAGQLGVNPNTVKKAYDILENQGIITTISTKGTFIKDKITQVVESKRSSLQKEIMAKIEEYKKLGGKVEDIKKLLEK